MINGDWGLGPEKPEEKPEKPEEIITHKIKVIGKDKPEQPEEPEEEKPEEPKNEGKRKKVLRGKKIINPKEPVEEDIKPKDKPEEPEYIIPKLIITFIDKKVPEKLIEEDKKPKNFF